MDPQMIHMAAWFFGATLRAFSVGHNRDTFHSVTESFDLGLFHGPLPRPLVGDGVPHWIRATTEAPREEAPREEASPTEPPAKKPRKDTRPGRED